MYVAIFGAYICAHPVSLSWRRGPRVVTARYLRIRRVIIGVRLAPSHGKFRRGANTRGKNDRVGRIGVET